MKRDVISKQEKTEKMRGRPMRSGNDIIIFFTISIREEVRAKTNSSDFPKLWSDPLKFQFKSYLSRCCFSSNL